MCRLVKGFGIVPDSPLVSVATNIGNLSSTLSILLTPIVLSSILKLRRPICALLFWRGLWLIQMDCPDLAFELERKCVSGA